MDPCPYDEVIKEMDLYLSKDINDIYLLQFPLRQEANPEEGIQARFKSQSELLELLVPIDTDSEFYSSAKDPKPSCSSSSVNNELWNDNVSGFQHLTSLKIPPKSNYFAGLISDDKFFIVPLQSFIQLRPSLCNSAQQDIKPKDEAVDFGSQNVHEKSKALQVQFRKKESQAETLARLKSYSHLQKLADEESWTNFEFLSCTVRLLWLTLVARIEGFYEFNHLVIFKCCSAILRKHG